MQQAVATPHPEDRAAFANQLAEVRAMDAKREYTKQLNDLEVEYQFILLRSLLRGKLPERLHNIKEKLCDTAVYPTYHTNLPYTSWNWNIKICRHCHKNSLKPILASNELCCENCGLLEPLDGVSFDVNEIYKCGDYKVVKQRRSTRRYNFRNYLEKHVKLLSENGHTLSCETIVKANEFFEVIEEQLPKRISMPFVVYQILRQIAQSEEERHIQTTSGCKFHKALWRNMQRSGSTCFDSSMLCELRPNLPRAGKGGGKTIHERSGYQSLHQAAPSAHKDPYAGADRTLGRWFPYNTGIPQRSRGRETQGSPKDNVL